MTASSHHQKGMDLFHAGCYAEAAQWLEKSIAEQETSERRSDWAAALLQAGWPTQAEAGFRRALDLDPANSVAAANLGVLLASSQRTDEALVLLERALQSTAMAPAQQASIQQWIEKIRPAAAIAPRPSDLPSLAMPERPKFYMNIELPDGSFTGGPSDHTSWPAHLGLSPAMVAGKRVLDVASNDGFWAFWAEKHGAAEVLAIDVEDYAHYDWSFGGPPASVKRGDPKNVGFWWLHQLLRSRVRREPISVYQLDPEQHGVFDIAVMCGLLYHLRHPLLALDTLRRVCNGVLIVETHIACADPLLPASLFYMDDVFRGHANWTGPTEAAVVHWLCSAGFPTVYVERDRQSGMYARQKFIACANSTWAANFQHNPNFQLCDSNYFRQTRAALETRLGLPPTTTT